MVILLISFIYFFSFPGNATYSKDDLTHLLLRSNWGSMFVTKASYTHSIYDVALKCTYCEGRNQGLEQINFDIILQDFNKIGEILLQFYPNGGYYRSVEIPTLRLRSIEIEDGYRGKSFGTQSLEILFNEVRTRLNNGRIPKNTVLFLEFSCFKDVNLTSFYEKFGFEDSKLFAAFDDVKIFRAKVRDLKFPYLERYLQKVKK